MISLFRSKYCKLFLCLLLVFSLCFSFYTPASAVALIDDLAVTGIIAALGAFGLSMSSIGNNGSGIASTVRGWIDSSGADATGASASVVGGGVLQVNSIAMRTAKAIYDWITGLFADDDTFDGSFAGSYSGVIPADGTYTLDSAEFVPPAVFLASFPRGGEIISYVNSRPDLFQFSINDLGYIVVRGSGNKLSFYMTVDGSPIASVNVHSGWLSFVDEGYGEGVNLYYNGRGPEAFTLGTLSNTGNTYKIVDTVPGWDSGRVAVNIGASTAPASVTVDSNIDVTSIPLNDGYIVTPFSFITDGEAIADFNEAISLGESYTGEYTDVYEPDISVPDYTDTLDGIRDSVDSINVGVGEGVGFLEGILDGVLALTADIGGFITDLPSYLSSFAGKFTGIWHYVVSWVGSLGSFLGLLFTVFSGLPYAMVLPVYATAVIVLVVGMWRRFFG